MTMRETGSLCGLVPCRQVPLHPWNIVNDRIGCGQQFDDVVNGSIRCLTFSQVVKCECCTVKAHVLPPVDVGLILIFRKIGIRVWIIVLCVGTAASGGSMVLTDGTP